MSTPCRLFLISCVAGLFLPGCTQLPPEAKQQLETARDQYQSAHYSDAVATAGKFLALHASHPVAAEAYYIRGQSYLKLGQTKQARADLQQALDSSKRPDLTARLHATLGSLDYADDNLMAAADHYRQAVPALPNVPPKDLVLFRLGLCLQRQGEWPEARKHFAQLISDYPASRVAESAKPRFNWPHDFFTIQVGAFSKPELAQRQLTVLRQAGLPAQQRLDTRSGRPLYVVQVGQYQTYADAQTNLPKVQTAAGEAIIVP